MWRCSQHTPLSIKLLFLASPSRQLDLNRNEACVCEERTLRRSQTRQAQRGLTCKAAKCSDAGTGTLGVLTTHEPSPWFFIGDADSGQDKTGVDESLLHQKENLAKYQTRLA